MNKQYDFGEKKQPTIKTESVVIQNSNIPKKEYDFDNVTEMWMNVAKAAHGVANAGYMRNIGRGAGAGAVVGGVGGVINNTFKSDNDPTKKGFTKSFIGGAAKGATAGATIGAAAKFAANRDFGKELVDKSYRKAMQSRANASFNNELRKGASETQALKAANDARRAAAVEIGGAQAVDTAGNVNLSVGQKGIGGLAGLGHWGHDVRSFGGDYTKANIVAP